MLREVLTGLRPRAGGRYVDATIGGAGHAEAILAASRPDGWLFGCDRDGAAIDAATQRLEAAGFGGRFEIRRGNFSEVAGWIPAESWDGVLFDFGVSSPQLDEPERGFSFQADGPLDMRMDRRQELTAAEIVNHWSEAELADLFFAEGGEPQSRRLARAIGRERAERRFATTGQLASFIERIVPRHGQKKHPATRVFQALRMAVNDESHSIRSGLAAACTLLRPGGRLVVITFHSGEDRLVKEFGREQTRDYTYDGPEDIPALRRPQTPRMNWIERKAVPPSEEELAANPRARSAQLRVLEKR
jgi:16S rRNA (cytosine1402-N4)-methyltransferase